MGDFKLILLNERERPIREARPEGPFSLILFRNLPGMAKPGIRAEVVSKEWLNARDTMQRLEAVIRNRHLAVSTLLARIRGGLIQTAAVRSRWEYGFYPDTDLPIPIPPAHWAFFPNLQTAQELAFWQTSDIRFNTGELNSDLNTIAVTYFGVRFEPQGITEMIEIALHEVMA